MAHDNIVFAQRHDHIDDLVRDRVGLFFSSWFCLCLLSGGPVRSERNKNLGTRHEKEARWCGYLRAPSRWDSMNGTRIKQSGNQSICRGCCRRQKKMCIRLTVPSSYSGTRIPYLKTNTISLANSVPTIATVSRKIVRSLFCSPNPTRSCCVPLLANILYRPGAHFYLRMNLHFEKLDFKTANIKFLELLIC